MDAAADMATAPALSRRIRVRGQVQAVGFRPHVWRIAHDLGLSGSVANDGEGVIIHAGGSFDALEEFARRVAAEAPPLSRIDALESEAADHPANGPFRIVESAGGRIATGIVPDSATCPECLSEIMDAGERRHGHAFANCTHCGPRLSIIRAIPYDRASTSMAAFPMCPGCQAEYADPADRRFHAQPVACPDCGPRLWLHGDGAQARDAIERAAEMLHDGLILAIKGIGGFHLACDARNAAAVSELRRRKARDAKPFAVMAGSLEQAGRYCSISDDAAALLASSAAPIVLLPTGPDAALPEALAPGQDHLGIMLAYSPLHHLLIAEFGGPLVMTSGNRSDEPQAIGNDEALDRLSDLADDFLLHDRDIVNRVDDSVVAIDGEGPLVLRRARGLAPAAIAMPHSIADAPPVLALGGELKVTACLLRNGEAVVTQHVGDLEDAMVLDDYRRMLAYYRDAYRFEPAAIAVDAHPDYLSTQLGKAMAQELGVPLVEVAHHHAHMASCMAEHRVDGPCHALVLDGLGMGADGTLWGGELLHGDLVEAERLAALPAVALPGGAAAMRQPWRNLVAHLVHAFGDEWRAVGGALIRHIPGGPDAAVIAKMAAGGLNSPKCSSAGRVFDAVAAALGVHAGRISYEGQAAMALEAMARPHGAKNGYPAAITTADVPRIDFAPLWLAMGRDIAAGVDGGIVAARFHAGLCDALMALLDGCETPVEGRLILSGGVMQNRIMRHGLCERLAARGIEPLHQQSLPANDGGLSLGQAAIAAARLT